MRDIKWVYNKVFVDRADDVTKKQSKWMGLPDEDLVYHIIESMFD